MKIIRKARLRFTEGKSDKVYEVDLCQTPTRDSYVVNFRYGRFGAKLREGTKTSSPVDINEANKIFDSLFVAKTNKGYIDVANESDAATSNSEHIDDNLKTTTQDSILRTILGHIEKPPSHWPISRIAWRVGELGLTEACDKLIKMAGKQGQALDYAIAWSLGRCGNSRHLDTIKSLQTSKYTTVRKIANEAYLLQAQQEEVKQVYSTLFRVLPSEVRKSIEEGRKDQLYSQLDKRLMIATPSNIELIETLYSLALRTPMVHDVLCRLLLTIPVTREHYFKAIRHLYKVSEMRLDGIIFGLITIRMDASPAGSWQQPFQIATKQYMSKRSWRSLKKLGEADSDHYVSMAAGVLRAISDEHAGEEKTVQRQTWNWDTQNVLVAETCFDRFSDFYALNHILYTHSEQYQPLDSRKAWKKVGQQEDQIRTEAFPHLWDKAPHILLELLIDSRCDIVHRFATKALQDNEAYCAQIDSQTIGLLLASVYETTADFSLQLARSKYNARAPDTSLIAACLRSPYEPARAQALTWIEEAPSILRDDLSLYAVALGNMHDAVRKRIIVLIPALSLSSSEQEMLITNVIEYVSKVPDGISNTNIKILVADLTTYFSRALLKFEVSKLSVLFESDHVAVQLFAGLLLTRNQIKLGKVPEKFIDVINQSNDDDMQGVAVELLNKYEDRYLLEHQELLFSHLVSARRPVREAVGPIIGRLASQNRQFGTSFLKNVITQIFKSEPFEGLYQDLIEIASTHLRSAINNLDLDLVWRLVNAKSKGAQILGSLCLSERKKLHFSVRQWAHFANNPTLTTRQWAMDAYKENISRIKQEPSEALRILNSKWDDSRGFAIDFFRKHFDQTDWNASLIIHICDNTYDDVQRFGRELITEFFEDGDGEDYLTKLSQHPSRNVQLFTTNYLEQYAGGKPHILSQLRQYFLIVLSNVYKGRIAKDRVCRFLLTEALKSREVAEFVAEIFERQSVTMCIQDKAAYIAGMHAIQMKYSDLSLPINIKTLPIKTRSKQEAHHGV